MGRKRVELAGRVLGELTVLALVGTRLGQTYWQCRCSCGNIIEVARCNLRPNGQKSCGCTRFRNLMGQRFGHLMVLCRKLPSPKRWNGAPSVAWVVRCDCGVEKTMRGDIVVKAKSCGCGLGAEFARLPPGIAVRNLVLRGYKDNAAHKKIAWELSNEQTLALLQGTCTYCGEPPTRTRFKPGANGGFTSNGIDRVDNSKGYIPDNVVSCCEVCNYAKRDMPVEKFLAYLKRAGEFQRKDATKPKVGE